jgi:hypothetical protein
MHVVKKTLPLDPSAMLLGLLSKLTTGLTGSDSIVGSMHEQQRRL